MTKIGKIFFFSSKTYQFYSILHRPVRVMPKLSPKQSLSSLLANSTFIQQIQRRIEKLGVKVGGTQIEKNWNLLKSVGCSDDHINCYPKILSIPTPELMKHISRLQEIGCHQISVRALRISRIYKTDATECEKRV